MSLVGLLIVVVIIGLIVYVLSLLPIPQPFKTVAYIIVVVIILVYLLEMLGAVGPELRVR